MIDIDAISSAVAETGHEIIAVRSVDNSVQHIPMKDDHGMYVFEATFECPEDVPFHMEHRSRIPHKYSTSITLHAPDSDGHVAWTFAFFHHKWPGGKSKDVSTAINDACDKASTWGVINVGSDGVPVYGFK